MSIKLDTAEYSKWTQKEWQSYLGNDSLTEVHNSSAVSPRVNPDFYDTMGKVALFGSKEFVNKMDTVAVSYPRCSLDDPDGSLRNAAVKLHNEGVEKLAASGKSFIRSIITETGVSANRPAVTYETIYVRTKDNKWIELERVANHIAYGACKEDFEKCEAASSQQWKKVEYAGNTKNLTPICENRKLVQELTKQISEVAFSNLIIENHFG